MHNEQKNDAVCLRHRFFSVKRPVKKMEIKRHKNKLPVSRFEEVAMRVTTIAIACNLGLAFIKLLAGFIGHSQAMVSDGANSSTDVLSSIIVIIGVKISERKSDREHPYGHERFESVTALVLSAIFLLTAFFIGFSAVRKITFGGAGELAVPGLIAVIAAAVSIMMKIILYRYTMRRADEIDSSSLRAAARDHRNDAISSGSALLGIWFARMGYPVLDPVASFFICALIFKSAVDTFLDAVDHMVDHSCEPETEEEIRARAAAYPGVDHIDLLQTRVFGSKVFVDMEISVDGDMSLREAHRIAEGVHDAIEGRLPKVKHIMVHVNPTDAE